MPAFFGSLLVLLSNLKHLDLSCYVEPQNTTSRLSIGGFSELYFSKKGVTPPNYDFLQHLKIESLDFSGRLTSPFLNLSHLRRVTLSPRTALELTPGTKSNLTHVEMHVGLRAEDTQQDIYPVLKALLGPSTKHITTHLLLPTKVEIGRDCVTNESPMFEYLLQDLYELVPDLETLELKTKFEWDPSGEIPEIASEFEKLGSLTINGVQVLK